MTRVRHLPLGDIPGCGTRVDDGAPVTLAYDCPIAYWEWVVQLNYLASAPGEITLRQGSVGPTVRVPLERGPHTLYVRVPGAGDGLIAHAETQGLIACVSSGPVGLLIPASIPDPAPAAPR